MSEGHLPLESAECDVLVVGAGPSGTSAAIAAGEAGARVIVSDMNSGMGGVGTAGGINSYWFARREGHNVRLTSAVRDLETAESYASLPDWNMKMWPVERKKQILQSMAAEAGVTIRLEHRLVMPLTENQCVTGALLIGPDTLLEVRAKVTIDATGDGDLAAARCVQSGVQPWNLNVRALQSELLQRGQLPEDLLTRDPAASEPACAPERIARLLSSLEDSRPLTRYQDMDLNEAWEEEIPFVELCVLGETAVPSVFEEFQKADSPRRGMCALILAWNGDARVREWIEDRIRDRLSDVKDLPVQKDTVRYAHASPDQGNMPETAYLLNALSFVASRESVPLVQDIVRRIHPTERAFQDPRSGLFDYVDAVCALAGTIAHSDLLPVLRQLHAKPLLHGNLFTGHCQAEYFAERRAFLEVQIVESLVRCGDRESAHLLASFSGDRRAPVANAARAALRDLGISFDELDRSATAATCKARRRQRDGEEDVVWLRGE